LEPDVSLSDVLCAGHEVREFPFAGLQREFASWLDTFRGASLEQLSPEQALSDLLAVESLIACGPKE
jgi:hypothetical protein